MDAISLDVFRTTPYTYQFHATGQVYHAWYEQASLAQDTTVYLEIRHTASKIAHVLDYILKSDSTNIDLTIYKDPQNFTPGNTRSSWTSYNHLIDKAPSLELYQDPTGVNLTGAETTFRSKGFGPAQGGQVSFSDTGGQSFIEEIQDYNSSYLVAITNNGTAARQIFFHMAWYESGN